MQAAVGQLNLEKRKSFSQILSLLCKDASWGNMLVEGGS